MSSETPDSHQEPLSPPTTPEQALAIFHRRYAEPKLSDGSPAELGVHEFDEGFLIYPILRPADEHDGASPRPAAPGGGKVVVSKETGTSYGTPNVPTEQAIALYRKNRERDS